MVLQIRYIKAWIREWNLRLFYELWIFSLIFYFIHFSWQSFSDDIAAIPFMAAASDLIGRCLLTITPPILNTFLHMGIIREGMSLALPNEYHVLYGFDLSGIKQLMTVLLLFLLIDGPWRKKAWFLPLNAAILVPLIIFRFIVLTAHCTVHPEHFHILQAILFGPMFYFELIILWIAWVLFIARTGCGDFAMPDIIRRPGMVQALKN
jgi:hypothetical protein